MTLYLRIRFRHREAQMLRRAVRPPLQVRGEFLQECVVLNKWLDVKPFSCRFGEICEIVQHVQNIQRDSQVVHVSFEQTI